MTIAPLAALLFSALLLWPQPYYSEAAQSSELYKTSSAKPLLYVPPRAYVICWKGICDPRLWAEMGKRTPLYNFGLGKRSPSEQLYYYDDDDNNSIDDAWDGDSEEDADAIAEGVQGTENAPLNIEKRSKYSFGVGKKSDYHRRFDFGLGKRGDYRFGFGLGKRQRFNFGLGKREVDPDSQEEVLLESDEGQGLTNERGRVPTYSAYGRSGPDDGRQEVMDEDKRSRMYEFGLGKRNMMYSFGLGKRDKMYNFGLGKRNLKYGFGLGKRDSARSDRLYAFGLGKRSYGQGSDHEATMDYTPTMDEVKRAGPYSFGLGKRSISPTQSHTQLETDRLQGDGLGKPDGDPLLIKTVHGDGEKTTAAPTLDDHQKQQEQQH